MDEGPEFEAPAPVGEYSDPSGPSAGLVSPPRRNRIRALALVALAVVAIGTALVLTYNLGYQSGVPRSEIATLVKSVSQAYGPDWTVESVYVQPTGGLLFHQATWVSVLLKWQGPQDFRTVSVFTYGASYPGGPMWGGVPPSLLQDHRSAEDFIAAFKRRHPQPGWVIEDPGQSDASTSSADVGFMCWNREQFPQSNGGLADNPVGHAETWRATPSASRIQWSYVEDSPPSNLVHFSGM